MGAKTAVAWARLNAVSLGPRLVAAAMVVATILIYGGALASLGLALATWIKRQSRAIATSVTVLVLVTIAWPFLLWGSRYGAFGPLANLRMPCHNSVLNEIPQCPHWTRGIRRASVGQAFKPDTVALDTECQAVKPGLHQC
jgi:hypothetical protein